MVYMIVTIVSICLSGRQYGHYGMIFVPAAVYPISSFLENLRQVGKSIMAIVMIYLLSAFVLPAWIDLAMYSCQVYANRAVENHSDAVMEVCQFIASNTTGEEKISVYGNWDIIYVMSQRLSASKYSYQYPIGSVAPDIMDEYFNELEMSLPKIIVIESGRMDERMKNFINEKNYEEARYQKDTDGKKILVYKLIE